eukprot:12151651-Ditylum_brightwellii.AAC.2
MLRVADAEKKKKTAAGKWNILAMAHITMTLGIEALLNKVKSMCDNEWPVGLAYKLIDKLKIQYQPKYRVATVKMKRKMGQVKMKKNDKPSIPM